MSRHIKIYEAWKASKTESKNPSRVNENWKPLTDKAEIEAWLEEMEIENYTINDDGTVDVNGDVQLEKKDLKEIPVQFGVVKGDFECYQNQLISLSGCPKEVKGDFWCFDNQLTSLEGAPQKVGGSFWCNQNRLTSLEGAPKEVGGTFNCQINKLTSLEGAPKAKKIESDFDTPSKHKINESVSKTRLRIYLDEEESVDVREELEKLIKDNKLDVDILSFRENGTYIDSYEDDDEEIEDIYIIYDVIVSTDKTIAKKLCKLFNDEKSDYMTIELKK